MYDVQGVVADDGAVGPRGLHEDVAAHGVAGRGGEAGEQAELGGRELDHGVSAARRVGRRVEPQRAGHDRRLKSAGAAQQRVQTGDELGELEGLGEVVVAPRAEAGQAIRQGVARREEQHRRADALRAQGLAHVAAVGVRQADVDDEGVDGRARTQSSSCAPVPTLSAR